MPEFLAGSELYESIEFPNTVIVNVSWSHDGKRLAIALESSVFIIWDAELKVKTCEFACNFSQVTSLAWSLDGRLASLHRGGNICVWDTILGIEDTTARVPWGDIAVAMDWSPDGKYLALLAHTPHDEGAAVYIWDTDVLNGTYKNFMISLRSHRYKDHKIKWSPDGKWIAVGSSLGIEVFNPVTRHLKFTRGAHINFGRVTAIDWSPDSQNIACAYSDRNIRIWNTHNTTEVVLEGHTAFIHGLSFSSDGKILFSKSPHSVRCWRSDTWQSVGVVENSSASIYPSLAIGSGTINLVAVAEPRFGIFIWHLNTDMLINESLNITTAQYSNAKIALVGDSGVGKTGLGHRLATGEYKPTEGSTHGMNVWKLPDSPHGEILLWDFAGQPEYRLVHQLFLNETTLALMLYDPTKSDDTFFGIRYWEKALTNAVGQGYGKFLVASRTDVGEVRMTQDVIDHYCQVNGYLGHFGTSAQKGWGCEDLLNAILNSIPWDTLPKTSSPEVFKRIKDYLSGQKLGQRILIREQDLFAEFSSASNNNSPIQPTDEEFGTVLGHVENHGLIKRLSFGGLVLMKPELLNSCSSDIIDAARRHVDGLGCIAKKDLLEGQIRINNEDYMTESDKILLLHATVEIFLKLGLALEQDGNLVFPSKFNQEMPPLESNPLIEVEYSFFGPVENIYTTLVVKLYYGGIFSLRKLWKNAAEFENHRGRVCGFQLQNSDDGEGIIKVFYSEGVNDDDKALFLKIIADHFEDKGLTVRRRRLFRCVRCGNPPEEKAVSNAIQNNWKEVICQYCSNPNLRHGGGEWVTILLQDNLEGLYNNDSKFRRQLAEMEATAAANVEFSSEIVSASAELKTSDFRSWSGSADIATIAIVFTDIVGSTAQNTELGDELWSELRNIHFEHLGDLIESEGGYLIKTMGDGVMAAFHNSRDAINFALETEKDNGLEDNKIRIGIHVGPVRITTDDIFGQHVAMAARIQAQAIEGGIWMSENVRNDILSLRSKGHANLAWEEHPDQELKGFGICNLWSVKSPDLNSSKPNARNIGML